MTRISVPIRYRVELPQNTDQYDLHWYGVWVNSGKFTQLRAFINFAIELSHTITISFLLSFLYYIFVHNHNISWYTIGIWTRIVYNMFSTQHVKFLKFDQRAGF